MENISRLKCNAERNIASVGMAVFKELYIIIIIIIITIINSFEQVLFP